MALIDRLYTSTPETYKPRGSPDGRPIAPGVGYAPGASSFCLHDSMHTTRNLSFELAGTWPALVPGGAVLIDDVDRNIATGLFLRGRSDAAAAISSSADGRALIGLLVKAGARSSAGSACAR